MKFSLKGKIAILAILSAVLPMLIVQILSLNLKSSITMSTEVELDKLTDLNVRQITKDVYGIMETANEILKSKLQVSLNLLEDKIKKNGNLNLSSELVQWNAINQFSKTKEQEIIKIPKMLIGNNWFGQNNDFKVNMAIVDDNTALSGSTTTIFQKINSKGDMLRIATSVPNSENKRAIGTYIPAIEPDGTRNAVISTVMEGKTYWGSAYVVNDWYLTAYKPYYNSKGEIIGMIYVGEKLGSIESLRKAVKSIKVGKTGYVFVLGAKEPYKGRYIISKDGERDGENLWEATDATGRKFVQDIYNKAIKLNNDEIYIEYYDWQNHNETESRQKLAAITYFKEWGWILGTSIYEDEFHETQKQLESEIVSLMNNLIYAGVIVIFIVIFASFWYSDRIAKPLNVINRVAKLISEGDLLNAELIISKFSSQYLKNYRNNTKDESKQLFLSFVTMADNLKSLISQVQKSGIQVTTSATQISASARELEATVAEQAASTKEVTATSKEIADSAHNFSLAISIVQTKVSNTSKIVEVGRESLLEMDKAIRDLVKATLSITAKLSVISDKANKISTVITTINKISDQTNLLSLNAAIEAEKAGEFGKGFSVVAREISRLAEQTAISTKDIEYMVREMQGSVSSGVMEMDKFSREVKTGTDEIQKMGDKLTEIIDQVNNLIPDFDNINTGISSQSEGADQISEAMVQLSATAQQSKESLTEFKYVIMQLNEAVQGLQSEVTKFKVG